MTVCGCGRPRKRGEKFCPECGARFRIDDGDARWPGAPKSSAPPSRRLVPERKQVAVLFADVCGSTARVARSDPEEARHYLDQALVLMKAAVAAYGGTISQTLGDGVLALFGAPSAQEDYVLRACLAGQDIQRRALEWNRGVDDEARSIEVRVGIDCGEVVVSREAEYIASHYRADGVPVHVARRLEQAAKPGTVVISGAAFRQLEHRVAAQPLGARRLEGIAEDVELYELALRSAVAPLAGRRHAAPLVGRDELLSALDTIAGQVPNGRMHCIGLRGEAGAGKSRLIVEFCRVQSERGFASFVVSAHGYTSHLQYAVVADLMRALLQPAAELDAPPRDGGIDDWFSGEPMHRAAAIDLLGLGEAGESWKALTPAQRRRRIGEALQWLLVRRASEAPLLIVIEDLMRADRESVRLIEQLLRRTESLAVLVAVTYRDGYQPPWQDAFWFSEHWVRLLERREMQQIAREVLGDDPSLTTAIERLVAKADGNPFYFEQMAMTLIDDGTLVGAPGAYRCARPEAKIRIPASIAVVIVSRVDRLPAPAKATLEAAAIAGEPISVPVLAAMRAVEPAEVLDHLATADAAGLLQVAGSNGGTMRFRHSLVQEVVARSLTQPRRKALHRAALSALRAHAGEAPDQAALLAQHAFSGEAWPEAAHFALASMSWSIARSANREALEVFDLGMEAARRIPSEAARLPLELGLLTETLGALLPLGRGEQLLANLDRAGDIARKLGNARQEAAVLIQYAVMLWTGGRYAQGLDVAREAEMAAISAGSRSLQMAAAQARMMLRHGLGHYDQVLADAREVESRFAAELGARRIMPGWAVLASLNLQVFKADILARADDLEGGQRACDAAYRELEDREHAFSRTLADFAQGRVWIEAGRYADAAALLEAALEYCRKHDVPTMYPPIFAHWGWALALAGRADEAAARLRKALDERLYLAGGRYNEFYLSQALALALQHAGRHAEARAAAALALEAARSHEQRGHEAEALFALGEAEAADGLSEEAHGHLARARELALECGMKRLVRQCDERSVAAVPASVS